VILCLVMVLEMRTHLSSIGDIALLKEIIGGS
jgi:hypothetical protein